MTITKRILGGVLLLSVLLCGCATSNVSVTSGVTEIDQDVIADRPVELPGGFDVDDFRRLRMGLGYGKIQSNTSAFKKKDVEDYMNLRFQSEMDKHKRFKFIALYGSNTAKFDALTDAGEMEANDDDDSARFRRPKMNPTWNINIQEKKIPDGSHSQKFQWYCTVNATASFYENVMTKDKSKVKHHKGDVAFTRDFDLPVIEKKQELNSMGGVKSGFSYKSDADVQALMQEIIIAATQRIADDLGRRFPVGGRVVGALGSDLFTIDKGTEQGVEKDMQMVVFARYDGVDVPLANAVASPAQDKSQLRVWRFANDKYARQILGEINGRPKQWVKETGNELFGVRAVPPQDDKKGTRFEK
ncbi:MAG: hypothetical protein ACI4RA_05245 [Kiritimatiellia bacterium]